MEKARRVRMPREGEIPTRMEKQDGTAEIVHAASSTSGQNDLRHWRLYRREIRSEIHRG